MKWFKHDSDARNSLKLRKVRRKYGAEGYAIYWFCLEAIAYEIDKDNLTFELKEDVETIAFELSMQESRVEEIMIYMVNQGLFDSSSGVISCLKLAERIDKSMTNSPKLRKWLEEKSVMTCIDNNMTSTDVASTCAELDKKRKEKKRLDNIKDSGQQVDLEEVISDENKATPSKVMKAFNEILGDKIPKIRTMTPNRIKHMRARVNDLKNDKDFHLIDEWVKFFTYLRTSCPFFIGETPGQLSGENTFVPDFDWLVKPDNFIKCVEGKYEQR